ncbi:NAD(P)H-hydrate dehydratase [Thalassotalea fusca]
MTVALLESLPQSAYSATQVLENEGNVANKLGINLYELMERAGHAVFEHIKRHLPEVSKICVLCGKGNNGGDGFVIARLAQQQGWQVTVVTFCEVSVFKGDALTAFEKLSDQNISIMNISDATLSGEFIRQLQVECIVDCLFGIGFKGELAGNYALCATQVNQTAIPVISVDIPSGLNATSGTPAKTCIKATHTVTFIAPKLGLVTGNALHYTGKLFLADLGIGQLFQSMVNSNVYIENEKAIPRRQKRHVNSHKDSVGLVLAVGGNIGMPGAIRLTSEAALRSGAGLVAVHCHRDNRVIVANGRPELMFSCGESDTAIEQRLLTRARALVCGPGLGRDKWAERLFKLAFAQDKPLVMDADALHFLSKIGCIQPRNNWVLTPHVGEAAKLLGVCVSDIERNRYQAVRNIAVKYGGICVLKGAGSLISDGSNVWVNTSGNPGMASGGMGDVLSGTIGALLVQMQDLCEATRLAVYVHGKAADYVAARQGQAGILASDLFHEIQYLLNEEA